MNRIMRLYYYGVLGAIGGVIGWQASNLLGLSFTGNVYLSEIVVGALIGFFIGLLIGMAEGLLTRNLLLGRSRRACSAALLGLAGGAIGLPLAEALFQLLGGQAWARADRLGHLWPADRLGRQCDRRQPDLERRPGWAAGRCPGQPAAGCAPAPGFQDPLLGKAAGLLLLGASVGAFIALIVFLLSRAWLEVTSGKLKGTEFILDKFMRAEGPSAFIGSDALKADIVLPDPDVAPQHAMLKGAGTHFNLKDMSLNGTFINDQRIEQAVLKNRQTIKVGNTQLVYHEKR